MRGGERDAPCAGFELTAEQLRRHGGFAVRRELNAVFRNERLHPLQVVFHAIRVQHGSGQTHVFIQQIPLEARGILELDAGARNHAQALAIRINRCALIVCNFHVSLLHRPVKLNQS